MNSWEQTTWKDTLLGLFIVGAPIAGLVALLNVGGSSTSPSVAPTTEPPRPIVRHVPYPIVSHNPPGTTVCSDGWVSHSTGRGTCSHHGGEH